MLRGRFGQCQTVCKTQRKNFPEKPICTKTLVRNVCKLHTTLYVTQKNDCRFFEEDIHKIFSEKQNAQKRVVETYVNYKQI